MPVTPQVKALSCPNCGGGVELRGYARTLNVVCINCLSVLDASTPELQVLQTFQARERVRPVLPLGTRGTLGGVKWEITGFQVRTIECDGEEFSWHEYLLFNPFKGFRYLTLYNGHWNFVTTVRALPVRTQDGGRPAVRFNDVVYKHFQTAIASTTYVMGEFPWQVRVGEQVQADDFIAPPRMLSSETTEAEVTWSLGEYTDGAEIWKAFKVPGSPPPVVGIYANQPAPAAGSTPAQKKSGMWGTWVLLNLILFGMMFAFSVSSRDEIVLDKGYTFNTSAKTETPGQTAEKQETAFVSEPFELKGRTSNVELAVNTDLDNDWAYFNFALVNEDTGQAYDFGREVGRFHGSDSDGSWSEGSSKNTVVIPSVPAGRYFLRVEPEMDASGNTPGFSDHRMSYRLQIRRDVPYNTFFWIAALLLLVPPMFSLFGGGAKSRGFDFEAARWQESDYASGD